MCQEPIQEALSLSIGRGSQLGALRRDTRAGHYERKLQTKAGEVKLRIPKLRTQTFETAIIERYRRRESSVEEADVRHFGVKCSASRGNIEHGGQTA